MLELALSIVENVAGFRTVSEGLSDVSWHNGSVVEEVQQSATVPGQDDLLLCSLNGGGKVMVIRFLELLAGL